MYSPSCQAKLSKKSTSTLHEEHECESDAPGARAGSLGLPAQYLGFPGRPGPVGQPSARESPQSCASACPPPVRRGLLFNTVHRLHVNTFPRPDLQEMVVHEISVCSESAVCSQVQDHAAGKTLGFQAYVIHLIRPYVTRISKDKINKLIEMSVRGMKAKGTFRSSTRSRLRIMP